ncbi:Hypothetical predicted protein [Olea europaea subsp. europaea]|uniref:Uncharacterized protein n=1 Tax=Olea europaea subsp. europaea TaxID=158383 RepID=A0A8S0T730_OLEEU|nr:Hypothetical predicted protein [Olea europaea subsp. europaea]
MLEKHSGHGRGRQFLSTVYRSCLGCVLAMAGIWPDFKSFLGSFWDTVCRLCPGSDRDAVGFQAFLGSCWNMAYRPYSGYVLGMAEMQPNFQAFLGSLWARCIGHVQDAAILSGISGTRCTGHVRAMAGTQVDFQAVCGHGVQAKSGTHPGHDKYPA